MFSEQILVVFGISAGVLNVLAFIPYIRDILNHKTKPQRATWWIWLTLNSIILAAQWATGVTWSLGLIIGQIIVSGIIAILSLRLGYGKFEKHDAVSLIIAAIGVLLWAYTRNPFVALVILVAVDALGSVLTVVKSWKSPETETLATWAVSVVANLSGVLASSSWTFGALLYPAYSFIANSIITAVIIWRRRVLKVSPKDPGM